jgi:hypothetical protein
MCRPNCNMIRSTRTIFLLAAFWLVTLTAPAAAAVTGWSVCTMPVAQAAKGGESAACPMKTSARHGQSPCCCCGADVSSKTHVSPHSQAAAILDLLPGENCACSFTPAPPVTQHPEAVVVLPFFSAVALLVPPASEVIAPSSVVALPQAPIRGPAAALLRSPILAPDAGRAPPIAV